MVQSIQAEAPPADESFGSGLEEFARQLLWERRLRTVFLPEEMFGEPAWDLLLDLYAGRNTGTLSPAAVRPLVRHGIAAIDRGAGGRGLRLTPAARVRIAHLIQEIWFNRASPDSAPPPASELAARAGRIDALVATLSVCQDELDSLQLWQPGADVSQAIEVLKSMRAADDMDQDNDTLNSGYP